MAIGSVCFMHRSRMPRSFWPRAVLITISSVFNSILHGVEVLRFCAGIRRTIARPCSSVSGERYQPFVQSVGKRRAICASDQYSGHEPADLSFRGGGMFARVVDDVAPEIEASTIWLQGVKSQEDEYARLALTCLSYQLTAAFPAVGFLRPVLHVPQRFRPGSQKLERGAQVLCAEIVVQIRWPIGV